MVIQQRLTMDLISRTGDIRVDAVQDDKYSRYLLISLYAGGIAWPIPAGTAAIIHYEKPDKTGGSYDTMPDGTAAYSHEGNVLAICLAPQVCTAAGPVRLSVSLIQGKSELTTFRIYIDVQAKPGSNMKSEDYVNLTGYVPVSGWSGSKYLGTDADGNVVELEAPEFAQPSAAQIQTAVDDYLARNPVDADVPMEDIQEAVEAYFADNPISVSDEAVQTAVDAYFAENPVSGGATAEQLQQIQTNKETSEANAAALAALPISVDAAGYTDISGTRRATKMVVTKASDTVINIDMTLQGDVPVAGVLTLDANGLPSTYTEDGIACAFEFVGFTSTSGEDTEA